MIKFDTKLDLDVSEITEDLNNSFRKATAQTMGRVHQKAKDMASGKLRHGLKFWMQGFHLERVEDGHWILVVDGKMANLIEEGFTQQEFKDMMLSGNRAKYNKAQGKNYVDVPVGLSADRMGGVVHTPGGGTIRLSQFRDADEMIQNVTKTRAPKNSGVRMAEHVVKRAKDAADFIKSREKGSKTVKFMTIRRLTRDSKWPKPWKGVKILEQLDEYIEQTMERYLTKYIEG